MGTKNFVASEQIPKRFATHNLAFKVMTRQPIFRRNLLSEPPAGLIPTLSFLVHLEAEAKYTGKA